MPPIRNPSLCPNSTAWWETKNLWQGWCWGCSLVIMLNQPEFYHRPPPGSAPDPRLMPRRVWSLGPAVSSISAQPTEFDSREEIPWEKESLGPTLGSALAACRHHWCSFVGRFLLNMRSICHYLLPAGSSVQSFLNSPQAGYGFLIPKRFIE